MSKQVQAFFAKKPYAGLHAQTMRGDSYADILRQAMQWVSRKLETPVKSLQIEWDNEDAYNVLNATTLEHVGELAFLNLKEK